MEPKNVKEFTEPVNLDVNQLLAYSIEVNNEYRTFSATL